MSNVKINYLTLLIGMNFKNYNTMKKFTLVAFLMLVSVFAFAQRPSEKKVKFGVYLGEATALGNMGQGTAKKTTQYPLGDLSKWALDNVKEGTDGYAGIGFNVGFDVTVNLPVEGLGIFGGIDFFFNANKSALSSCLEEYARNEVKDYYEVSKVDYNKPNFMNLPILFGVNYLHNFNNIVGIWGEAGIGPNFRFISRYEKRTEYNTAMDVMLPDGEVVTFIDKTVGCKYKSAVTLGFKLGAGVMLWDRMSIGLDYYYLGSAPIEATAIYELGGTDYADKVYTTKTIKGDNSISASELVVRVGYHF